ncbi:cytochrome-c oxidase, cbb3-type subunit III [Aureimonas fodinaquatilis]|uniref:Cbb3-type cytochrome c oxidase subunit n=1 Tax=Aureimonas fodinaquatilis TaxID=2565783 RepID=A0A5B0DZ46_9HYPH|nr:cytochrome-c oxidase, cbb3-type subunit III [Aureimonas fodinaquatilis]KAA0971803.1 cytochrome-c oxidase, cbb3-type subunit III [Aureimonas fodinaquatilis]
MHKPVNNDVPNADAHNEVDKATGYTTTGHEWDGIKELNRPLPRWWLWIFYATQVWALAYIVLYPSLPLPGGAPTGLLNWNSRAEVAREIDTATAARADTLQKIASLPLQEIVADDTLRNAAFRGGASAFKVNCVQCHGADAAGSTGYANLNDDDWLWGGTLDEIYTSIRHGIRFDGDDDTHISEMPAFGGILNSTEIDAVAQYVLAMHRGDADAVSPQGAELYANNCAACHGGSGEGERSMGAPRLNDAVWLYGGTAQMVKAQIRNPKHGVMPAWGGRLSDTVVKELAVYVHGLGGGEMGD